MTKAGHYERNDDQAFAAAWSAFADDDARASAPAALEARVREAAREACRRQHTRHLMGRHRPLLTALGTAAALALVAAGFLSRKPAVKAPQRDAQAVTEIAVANQPRSRPLATRDAPSSTPATVSNFDSPPAESDRDALVTLAVDPVQDTEQLALVRIRVSQDALLALGIATNEPGVSGLVDVEVLVGGDGLPRDIRRLRTVQTGEERD